MSNDHYPEFTKLLVDATDIVSESRNKDYGDFVQNHNDIAKIWNVVLKNNLAKPITADQVCMCMAGVKIARSSVEDGLIKDNYMDGIAYMGLAFAIKMKEGIWRKLTLKK